MDLTIRAPNLEALPRELVRELQEKIQESNIPILVDLFDWARLPESFHRNIEARHEVFFRK